MDQKRILNEFSAKISKAKVLHDTTQAVNAKLRKEAAQLQKEHDQLMSQRIAAQEQQINMKKQAQRAQKMKQDELRKCKQQSYELNELRKKRKQEQWHKDINDSELKKSILKLEEDVQKRQKLQATAKDLAQKLQITTSQNEALIDQLNKTKKSINKYDERIDFLKCEIEQMKRTISENTVPVHNVVNLTIKSQEFGLAMSNLSKVAETAEH